MKIVNRVALVVYGKEPFLKWARETGGPEWDAEMDKEARNPCCYLVPEEAMVGEMNVLLDGCWEMIFSDMLDGWISEKELWPEMSFELFKTWFRVERTLSVVDLADEEKLERTE
jgi:hypothetical protein